MIWDIRTEEATLRLGGRAGPAHTVWSLRKGRISKLRRPPPEQ